MAVARTRTLNAKPSSFLDVDSAVGASRDYARDIGKECNVIAASRFMLGAFTYLIVAVALLLTGSSGAAYGQTSLIDVTGRKVTIAAPAQRILLTSPVHYQALAILDRAAANRVVGIGGDSHDYLPETLQDLADKPRVGSILAQTFSVEKALALRPDIVIGAQPPRLQSPAIESAFAKAGVPVVYIDFYSDPAKNTDRSFEILGRALGKEDKAAEFVELFRRHVQKITDRLKTPGIANSKLLMISRGTGLPCCNAAGNGGMMAYFDGRGITNIAAGAGQGRRVQLSLEHVIESDPDVLVAVDVYPDSRSMFGQPRNLTRGVASLGEMKEERGFRELSAVRSGRVHAIDLYLTISPLNFVAFELVAKWAHPELFADIDPQATLDEINLRFLKTPLKGPFWVSLDPAADRGSGQRP